MADLYRVIYDSTGPAPTTVLYVTATSLANAIAAVKAADTKHKNTVTATVIQHNIVTGS
jgi:hypothetical protein